MLKLLFQLLSSEDFIEQLQEINAKGGNNFVNLMRQFTEAIESVSIEWQSPHPQLGGKVRLTPSQAKEMLEKIEQATEHQHKILRIEGILRGLDLKTRHFRLVDEKDRQYSGYVKQDAMNDSVIQSAQLNKRYVATIEENSEKTVGLTTANLKTELIKLDRINPPSKQE